MTRNPYTLVFGKEPKQLVRRTAQFDEVLRSFLDDDPNFPIYLVTGIRGSGKTVFMTEIANRIRSEEDWTVIELNPQRDLLTSLASKLSSDNVFAKIFKAAKINLSFFGFGLEVSGAAPIADIETAIAKMLESLHARGKRVLVTIDEASNTQQMREFASAFQIFIRQELPICLLMTGLFENVRELQNAQDLTFLYRAPRIELNPLNTGAMARSYRSNMQISDDDALEMARLTRGYSFAFQVLGYLAWNASGDFRSVMDDYRQYLEEYAYQKIWSELSTTDRSVARAIAQASDDKVASVRKIANMTTNQFNPYRQRLIRKGIIDGSEHGRVRFTLPQFDRFVLTA